MPMKELEILNRIFRIIREVDEAGVMPMQVAHCLFIVAGAKHGCTQQYIQQEVGLSQSSVNRAVQALSARNHRKEPGYGLVEQIEDPMDTRKKVVFLTPKGKELVGKVLGLQQGHFDSRVVPIDAVSAKEFVQKGYTAK